MQVKHSELNASLKEKCFPLYLIHGDDYFLMQEIKDKLLYFASRKGYLHREIIFIEFINLIIISTAASSRAYIKSKIIIREFLREMFTVVKPSSAFN